MVMKQKSCSFVGWALPTKKKLNLMKGSIRIKRWAMPTLPGFDYDERDAPYESAVEEDHL